MDINRRLREFNKRFSIVEDASHEEEFSKFKIRVLNIFSKIDECVTKEDIAQFCQIVGITEKWESAPYGGDEWSVNIINALILENNELKFYRLLAIISCLRFYDKGHLFQKLAEAIELSNVNLAMTIIDNRALNYPSANRGLTAENGEIIFYPKGEETLDETLVEEVLSFLNPESQVHFVSALKAFLIYSPQNAIKSGESLRRSLEEYLKHKLGNQRGLKENIKELQKKLKEDDRDTLVRSSIFSIFNFLDNYFNENTKHNDGDIDEAENEFLIYETGVLMRYIFKVNISPQ